MSVLKNRVYKNKSGKVVELIPVNGRGRFPIVGYIGDEDEIESWTSEGMCFPDGSPNSLIEIKDLREMSIGDLYIPYMRIKCSNLCNIR